MKSEYEPKTTDQKLGYLVEECGEVLAAVGKTIRWGLESVNPELSTAGISPRETNRDWILRELVDLERAIAYVRADFGAGRSNASILENEDAHYREGRRAGLEELLERTSADEPGGIRHRAEIIKAMKQGPRS